MEAFRVLTVKWRQEGDQLMKQMTIELIPDLEVGGFTARLPDIPAYSRFGSGRFRGPPSRYSCLWRGGDRRRRDHRSEGSAPRLHRSLWNRRYPGENYGARDLATSRSGPRRACPCLTCRALMERKC